MILIPKYRDIEIPVALKRPKFRGHFILEAVGLDGRVRKLAEFDNLITTNGANLLGQSGVTPLATCAVGSGNATPALGNTALQTLVTSTTTVNPGFPAFAAASSSPYFGTTTYQYAFAIGAAAGNLSEVGVGTIATNLFSRALILDGGGSPTTITVLSSEALYVTYALSQYVPLSDVTGSVTIASVSYAYTLRAASATATGVWAYHNGDAGGIQAALVSNGAIGAITGIPSGTSSSNSSVANNAYSAGSFTLSGTATWGLTQGNVAGGVTAAQVTFGTGTGSRGSYQIGFGTAIPKDASHVLTLNFSTSWAINLP